jgi:AcrR family transcriptional regulator
LPGKQLRGRRKDAAGTRRRVLQAAFSEIHECGFHAASLDRILDTAGVTKGALYHHFESKQALGRAVVCEVLGGWIREFCDTLAKAPDAIRALREWVERPPRLPLRLGCPLNNLSQELAATDEAFRRDIEAVFAAWRRGIAAALVRAQRSGRVRRAVDAAAAASFILAALEGSISLAKSARDETLFRSNMRLLSEYIEGLRAPSKRS